MKVLLIILLLPAILYAQGKIESKAYNWADFKPVKDENRIRRQYLDGSTTLLQNLEIHTSTVEAHEAPHPPHTHADQEELVIIKEGSLTATLRSESKVLGPGSVIYVVPGVEHGFRNAGDIPCTYYIIKFKHPAVPNDKIPTSFMTDWQEMKFIPHDKGGRRNVVDKKTVLFDRFEMHITTLNAGLSSHDPHTHTPEEIILMKEGEGEMVVGDKRVKILEGGLVFLDSNIPHNLTNKSNKPVTYFAFQWN